MRSMDGKRFMLRIFSPKNPHYHPCFIWENRTERRNPCTHTVHGARTMARHNEVTLYGQVSSEPLLLRESSQDPNSRICRVLSSFTVIRGIRDFGAKDQRMRLDEVVVMSGNEKIMDFMKEWHLGDIVSLRGTLITNDYNKSCTCAECGHTQLYKGYSAYVYPIYVRLVAQGYTPEQGLAELRRNAEISNRITVIGKACSKPAFHRHEKSGTPISSYIIDIERKYRVKEDLDSNRHDFPAIKSYGGIAENDYLAIEEGGLVFVDGQLQVRNYTRTFICENCGAEIQKLDNVTEIVPYSTEYLTGCHSMADVMALREQIKEQQEFQATQEMFAGGGYGADGESGEDS